MRYVLIWIFVLLRSAVNAQTPKDTLRCLDSLANVHLNLMYIQHNYDQEILMWDKAVVAQSLKKVYDGNKRANAKLTEHKVQESYRQYFAGVYGYTQIGSLDIGTVVKKGNLARVFVHFNTKIFLNGIRTDGQNLLILNSYNLGKDGTLVDSRAFSTFD